MTIRPKPTVKVVLPPHYLYTLLCAVFIHIMTVDRQHTEIFGQAYQMWAEGTSIGEGEGLRPWQVGD